MVLKDGSELVLRLEPTHVLLPGDECPNDNTKFAPGICGCGVSDADSNHDGIPNCMVTPLAKDLAQQIITSLSQVRKMSRRADKAQIAAQRTLVKQTQTAANQLYALVKRSKEDIRLRNRRTSALSLVSSIRTKLRLALNTKDRKFTSNRRVALASLKSFSKLLVIQ